MKANDPLSGLRSAAVRMVTAPVPNEIADLSSFERLSLRVTTYRASNLRASEFTLYGAHIEDIKAVVWCALHRTPAPLFEVEIYTDEYNRPLLRVDSGQTGYDTAIKTLADYFKQASKPKKHIRQ